MAVNPIPSGYHSITPTAVVDDANKAIDFYAKAFGAKETYRLPMGDKIGHAEMQIGDSRFMLSDEFEEWDALGPKSRGGATGGFMIYVPDVDAAIDRAVKAGAKVVQPAEDQFWGDRMGTVVDPFGRTIRYPYEVPVGMVMSVLGAVLFLALILRTRNA